MQSVNDKPETIHLYVVREEEPNAGSRDLLCKWLKELAVKTHASYTISRLLCMVEPRTRGWQKAWDHAPSQLAHPSLLLGRLIVLT